MQKVEYGGYCTKCQTWHSIASSRASEQRAKELCAHIEQRENLDIFSTKASSRFSSRPLWGEERGKMLGVLICHNSKGEEQLLYAFSGQYQGAWHIPGWALPLFSTESYAQLEARFEPAIKELSWQISQKATPQRKQQRKQLSQKWMKEIQQLYQIHNFAGECRSLTQATPELQGIPTGTGDCCAPKLLNQAAIEQLTPVALSEFYFGQTTRSKNRVHGHFYPSCTGRCAHLLGYMLCGINP